MGAHGYALSVLLSVLYSILCILLRTLLPRPSAAPALEVELPVLRRETRVLRRQRKRPRRCPADRVVLAAPSRCLPRAEWARFPAWPETLLRWRRDLVRRSWAVFGRRRGPGRLPMATQFGGLILRLAGENPQWG